MNHATLLKFKPTQSIFNYELKLKKKLTKREFFLDFFAHQLIHWFPDM